MDILEFIQSQENELRKPVDKINWEKIYEKALRTGYNLVSEFTEFLFSLNLHPEKYLKELPSHFLYKSTLKKFTIPDNIKGVGANAFSGCASLANVTIGNGVTSIGYSAFQNCPSLTSIVIPDSVTSIGYYAFNYCDNLTSVIIGNSITSIDYRVFRDCPKLTNVMIGNNVTNIDAEAFYNCIRLKSVTLPNSVMSINDHAFSYCGDNLVIDYSGSKEDWKRIYNRYAFNDTHFTVNCIDGKIVKKKE